MSRSKRSALVLVAALVAFVPGSSRAETVFEDHDLATWRFFADPGDPGIQLVPLPYGDPYLFVRHRHIAGGYSRKQSDQGAPAAVYRPATSGALASLAVSGRFRMHFNGEPLASYASTVLQVFPALRQSGRLYVADAPVYQWNAAVPLGVWAALSSGELPANRFLRDGLTAERPNFAADADPIEVGFRVVTSFQRGATEPVEHTFEVDLDDFRVEAVLDDGASPPRLFFSGTDGLYESDEGPVAVYTSRLDPIEAASLEIPVTLSRPLSTPLLFNANEVGGLQSPNSGNVVSGETEGSVWVLVRLAEHVLKLEETPGVSLGTPAIAAVLARPAQAAFCTMELFSAWYHYLTCQLGNRPSCELVPVAAEVGGEGEAPSMVTTLRRLRDEIMVQSAAGRRYRELYEGFDGALQDALLASPRLVADLFRSAPSWVEAIGALVDGDGASAPITATMAADLGRLLDELAAVAAPPLARAIAEERARLGLDAIAGLNMNQFWERVETRGAAGPCQPSANRLCLGGGRWAVEADFATPDGTPGRARAVPLSGDSGYFWFFDAANVELLTKVVAGCGTNQRFWSYNAGLTNLAVDLWVHDPASGQGKLYRSSAGENFAPILDSDFATCGSSAAEAPTQLLSVETPEPAAASGVNPGAACVSTDTALCLRGGRFRVEAEYRTAAGASGAARAVPLTDDTGTFWFFNAGNIELVVKTIDACGLAGFENYWVFAGGTTDVEVTLHVTDTRHDVTKTYRRPLGVPFAPILDSAAFETCP